MLTARDRVLILELNGIETLLGDIELARVIRDEPDLTRDQAIDEALRLIQKMVRDIGGNESDWQMLPSLEDVEEVLRTRSRN